MGGIVNSDATIKYDGKGGIQPVDKSLQYSDWDIIRQRRRVNRLNNPKPMEPDTADAAIKAAGSAGVLRARRGSGRSALGSFSPSKPLGHDSILGDY